MPCPPSTPKIRPQDTTCFPPTKRQAHLRVVLCVSRVQRDRLEVQPALEVDGRDDISACVSCVFQSRTEEGWRRDVGTYCRVGTRPSTTVISGTEATTFGSSLLISFSLTCPPELELGPAVAFGAVWGGRDRAEGLMEACGWPWVGGRPRPPEGRARPDMVLLVILSRCLQ